MTLIIPSAPPTPVVGLLGPVVWISQPEGQRSGLPIKPHLMSLPLIVWCVWNPQNELQKPRSLTLDDVRTRYTPFGSLGKPLLKDLVTIAVSRLLLSRVPCEPVSKIAPPSVTLPLTLPVLSP